MSNWVTNHVPGMIQYQGQTVNRFGLDQTGTIDYQLNQQGFRSPTDFDFVPDYAFFGCSSVFGIGVAHNDIFASMFPQSHNYGLAGAYNNDDAFLIIDNYLHSSAFNKSAKKFVYWTNRNTESLDRYSRQLSELGFIQSFCGDRMPYKNCFPGIADVDADVSATHMGPATHLITYKLLCKLFGQ
jgi:hypothetical protein